MQGARQDVQECKRQVPQQLAGSVRYIDQETDRQKFEKESPDAEAPRLQSDGECVVYNLHHA